jgi:hypothetical protein
MAEHLVTCITKPNRDSRHEHITHIGNVAENWKITRERAIQLIDAKQAAFYTVDKATGRKAYVGVVRGDGNKAAYLRTHADGRWNDNLLAQYECGAYCEVV